MLATTMRYRGNRFLVIAHHSLTKLVKWHMATGWNLNHINSIKSIRVPDVVYFPPLARVEKSTTADDKLKFAMGCSVAFRSLTRGTCKFMSVWLFVEDPCVYRFKGSRQPAHYSSGREWIRTHEKRAWSASFSSLLMEPRWSPLDWDRSHCSVQVVTRSTSKWKSFASACH